MRGLRRKRYFLYLKDSRLIGVESHKGRIQKVLDTTVEDLSSDFDLPGEATLLINREDLQHHIMPVPKRGKISVRKMIDHEVELFTGSSPSEALYDWRIIGSGQEEGAEQTIYLIASQPRLQTVSLLETFAHWGLKVTKIVSSLDLLIEKGRKLQQQGGSGLMVFEEPMVHFLFFKDGTYGFQRSFELRGEGFQKDLLLEIQRSFFYTKQKFKITIEKVGVLLAPEWLQGEMAAQLEATLGVPVEFLSPTIKDCRLPEIHLLNIILYEPILLPPLLNLLPAEMIREVESRKLGWALTLTEAVILGLMLLWVYNAREFQKSDFHFHTIRNQQLQSIQAQLESQHDKIERLRKTVEETATVQDHLKEKKYLHLYLKALPLFIPQNVHVESIAWGAGASEESRGTVSAHPTDFGGSPNDSVIMLTGQVTTPSSDEKYADFFQFVDNLESAPFVEKVDYQSEELLTKGLFTTTIFIKNIGSRNDAH
ncbi:MAG: hypothetical protein JXD19_08960 [Deltaproteobacteria bacterium]|nr:hypothetical protein [Deltaproteobacteria bacterium]